MKSFLKRSLVFLSLNVLVLIALEQAQARDLTYKIGAGYSQVFTNAFVLKDGTDGVPRQLNGIMASYGIAQDLQVGGYFGFEDNFDHFMAGPFIRYDVHRLFNRELMMWNHLNIFVQTAFFIRTGGQVETGITLQAPYVGFEVFTFSNNFFSIQTAAGVVIDFMKDNAIGFTNGMFGDVGVKYYF